MCVACYSVVAIYKRWTAYTADWNFCHKMLFYETRAWAVDEHPASADTDEV